MTKKKKRVLAGCGCLAAILSCAYVLIFIFIFPTNEIDNALPEKKAEMWKLTQEWGKIPDLPPEATGFTILTQGNAFSRTFVSEFDAPTDMVTQWLASFIPDNPEPVEWGNVARENPRVEENGDWVFEFPAADGNGFGTITVSGKGTHVHIRVSWS